MLVKQDCSCECADLHLNYGNKRTALMGEIFQFFKTKCSKSKNLIQ